MKKLISLKAINFTLYGYLISILSGCGMFYSLKVNEPSELKFAKISDGGVAVQTYLFGCVNDSHKVYVDSNGQVWLYCDGYYKGSFSKMAKAGPDKSQLILSTRVSTEDNKIQTLLKSNMTEITLTKCRQNAWCGSFPKFGYEDLYVYTDKSSEDTYLEYVDYRFVLEKRNIAFKNIQSLSGLLNFINQYPNYYFDPVASKQLVERIVPLASPQEHLELVKKIPKSFVAYKELTDAFYEANFTTKVEEIKSDQRPITESALLNSMAGSCRDITEKVTIFPRRQLDFANDVSLDLSFTLLRTYDPVALAEKDDPLTTKKNYVLKKDSGFTQTEVIRYPCVLTSGRFHMAGLSLIGRLFGMSKKDTGVNTTLVKMKLDMKIEAVQ